MGTILGGLLLPKFDAPDLGRAMNQGIAGGTGILQGQTALLALQEAKQKQAAEAEMFAAIQQNPALAQQFFGGGSILGSLQAGPSGPPGGGAMTQQQVTPGQAPGAPQGAPQSTIASLGPQPLGLMQAPRNLALEMAANNPRAAFMMQQQMQAQQLQQLTMQEKHLEMGVKVSEGIARQLQGVTDQESLDEARERVRLIHPQAATQIPQFYSKEAVEALQQRGIAMSDQAKNRHLLAQSRKLDVESALLPEMYRKMMEDEDAAPAGQSPATNGAVPPTSRQPGTLPGTASLSPQFQTKAQGIADRLGTNVEHLYRVMSFETGGEMSPATRNRAGSGATGLIQFTPETAKGLGTTTDALARMTPEQQLDYVEKYLAPYKGKISTLKDLYTAVLYPAALGKPDDTVLFSPDKTPAAYRQNAGLDTGKKGYVTVVDAVAALERTTGGRRAAGTGGTQEPPADPRIAQLDAKITQRTRYAQMWSLAGNESLSTRLNDDANRLTDERKRLIEESRHQQERREEIPRAAQKVTAEEQARYGEKQRQQGGPLLPEQQRDFFTKLRTDVRAEPTHRTYQEIRNGYQNVRVGAQSDSAQGDLAIFNGLAKILDPTGSVLSGEARNVESAQGQLQVWFNSPQKFFEGDRLTPENRQRFLKMAHALAKEKLTTAQTELKTVYGPLAKDAGIDFEQLVPLPDLKPLEPGPNAKAFDKLFDEK